MKLIFPTILIFLFLFHCFGQEDQTTDEFARLIKLKAVRQTNYNVTVKPKAVKISAGKMKNAAGKEVSVLSVPVEITNASSEKISINLAHEWYGGIWAPTDFYVAALVPALEKKMVWDHRPAYQAGNLNEINKTVLNSGASVTVDVRLNWRGTGSVPTEPLIDETVSGKYTIKFLLFFKTDVSEEYLLSDEFLIDVQK